MRAAHKETQTLGIKRSSFLVLNYASLYTSKIIDMSKK